MQIAAQIAIYLALPALLAWSEKRNKLVAALSPVVLCYAAGILLGNQPFLALDAKLSQSLAEGVVALAIPMLLFPTNLQGLLKMARPIAISFGLATVAVCVTTAVAPYVFAGRVADSWMVSAMLAAVFVGGTANMTAVAMALEVPQETFILVNTAEMLMGAVYLLLLLTVAKPILAKFLPEFKGERELTEVDPATVAAPQLFRDAALALLLSGSLIGLSLALSQLIFASASAPFIVLSLTTLAILGSTHKKIHNLAGSFEFGQYLLLVFCLSIGSLASFESLLAAMSSVLAYVTFCLVVAVALHLLLAKLTGVDVDTFMITSTATIFGPPFIGPVAAVLKNRAIVAGGIAAGVLGLAVGTYLGYTLAMLIKP